MALLRLVASEMTLHLAHLASEAVKEACDEVVLRWLPVGSPSGSFVSQRVDWIHYQMLKTRLASGSCSRHLAVGPCPCAKVCETCDKCARGPAFEGAHAPQLADVVELQDDDQDRSWSAELELQQGVADAIDGQLPRLPKMTRSAWSS